MSSILKYYAALILIMLAGCSSNSHKVYTNIENAMREPDKVKELDLSNQLLTKVPASVSKLPCLQVLNLSDNYIKDIPPFMFSGTKLTKLILFNNPIQPAIIDSLQNIYSDIDILYYPRLESCSQYYKCAGFADTILLEVVLQPGSDYLLQLDSFSRLQNVLAVDFTLVESRDIPKNINQFSNLWQLSMRNKGIQTLRSELFNLVNLHSLTLSGNKISFIPSEIAQLKKLALLDLHDNLIGKLPAELWQLKKLQVLMLDNNQIDELPEQIENLESLESLFLTNNRLRKLPEGIKKLKHLKELYLKGNYLDKEQREHIRSSLPDVTVAFD